MHYGGHDGEKHPNWVLLHPLQPWLHSKLDNDIWLDALVSQRHHQPWMLHGSPTVHSGNHGGGRRPRTLQAPSATAVACRCCSYIASTWLASISNGRRASERAVPQASTNSNPNSSANADPSSADTCKDKQLSPIKLQWSCRQTNEGRGTQ